MPTLKYGKIIEYSMMQLKRNQWSKIFILNDNNPLPSDSFRWKNSVLAILPISFV